MRHPFRDDLSWMPIWTYVRRLIIRRPNASPQATLPLSLWIESGRWCPWQVRFNNAANSDRVRGNTREDVNRRIDRETELRLNSAAAMRRQEIDHNILKLGREWDFERVLEAEAAITGLTGIVLALTVDKCNIHEQTES
jgi:hypothetical protein